MIVGQRVRGGLEAIRGRRAPAAHLLERWLRLPSAGAIERRAPAVIAVTVLAGILAVTLATSIEGRGDYGQWLMTSRYYLGEDVPDYRTITALPPLVPVLLAAIRLILPDPILALHALNGLLVIGIGLAFYTLGSLLLSSRWAGAFSVTLGLLVTDRFLELFAFGGLLQAAAIAFMALSVAAFARAGRGPGVVRRWWAAGTVSMAAAALAHVGTGTIAVPVGLSVAALAAVQLRHLGRRALTAALLPLLFAVAGVVAYWLTVLLPASADYVTNPASLAYRGPDRLFSSLFSYWPTTMVFAIGTVSLALGVVGSLVRRTASGHLVLLLWVAVTWGALLYSVVSGVATDYPRFSTLLLAPLVVAAAGGVLWLGRALAAYVTEMEPRWPSSELLMIAAVILVLVGAPFAADRYARQARTYQPRDAASLTAAVMWIDHALEGRGGSVLTEVRDGKWVEGLTGRAALFSQPVRYAFRATEWQRSADADALLRSTQTLSSGLVSAAFTSRAVQGSVSVPSGLLLSVNHGGEFVDVLQVRSSGIRVGSGTTSTRADGMAPVRASRSVTSVRATLSTVWSGRDDPELSLVQGVTVWRDGATLRLLLRSPGNTLSTELSPPPGTAITTLEVDGREAHACFTTVGGEPPCVRVWVAQDDVVVAQSSDGGLRLTTGRSDRLDVLVTALTAGQAAVGLGLLDPARLANEHDVGAALLYGPDPSFASRVRRLEALGFRLAMSSGPYRVLLRADPTGARVEAAP